MHLRVRQPLALVGGDSRPAVPLGRTLLVTILGVGSAACSASARAPATVAVVDALVAHCATRPPRVGATPIALPEGSVCPDDPDAPCSAGVITLLVQERAAALSVGSGIHVAEPEAIVCSVDVPRRSGILLEPAVAMRALVRALGPASYFYYNEGSAQPEATEAGVGGTHTVLALDDAGSRLAMDTIRGGSITQLTFTYAGPRDVAPIDHFAARRALPGYESAVAHRFDDVRAYMAAQSKEWRQYWATEQIEIDAIRVANAERKAQEEQDRRRAEAENQATILDALRNIVGAPPPLPGFGPDGRPLVVPETTGGETASAGNQAGGGTSATSAGASTTSAGSGTTATQGGSGPVVPPQQTRAERCMYYWAPRDWNAQCIPECHGLWDEAEAAGVKACEARYPPKDGESSADRSAREASLSICKLEPMGFVPKCLAECVERKRANWEASWPSECHGDRESNGNGGQVISR